MQWSAGSRRRQRTRFASCAAGLVASLLVPIAARAAPSRAEGEAGGEPELLPPHVGTAVDPVPAPAGERAAPAGSPSQLDFDLLGAAKPPPELADASDLRLRRNMLKVHQGIGLGLFALQLATTTVGQLSYSDQFAGGPNTARYQTTHKALAYATLSTFVVAGAIALLAPSAKTPRNVDRIWVHRVAMLAAAVGMATQVVLGITTRDEVGHLDQERYATAHLAVGYATLAATAVGVGVLVF